MAVVTIRAVECQMLRVLRVPRDADGEEMHIGHCRCGARVVRHTHEEAVEAIKEHRFHDGPLGSEVFSVEGSWQR